MYNNILKRGAEKQRKLYASTGYKVIDTHEKAKSEGKTPAQIKIRNGQPN